MDKMKITVGLGNIDDYVEYALAGADEIFFGYVPESWQLKNERIKALNRREVLNYNVQIGSYSELLILVKMIEKYGVKGIMTLNSLNYDEEDYNEILSIVGDCVNAGIKDYILADYSFAKLLKARFTEINIHMSGEFGQLNRAIIKDFAENGISRVIFPRQTSIEEIESMIAYSNKSKYNMEFEAFCLNEKCHFTGAYCNSLHCDEFCHMCQLPYKAADDKKQYEIIEEDLSNSEVIGYSGCGICALWKLKNAGVTNLKIVSRGNSSGEIIKDIQVLYNALKLLETANCEGDYTKCTKNIIFNEKCSKNCYYYF